MRLVLQGVERFDTYDRPWQRGAAANAVELLIVLSIQRMNYVIK